jgi:hypothetical protein
MLAGMLTAISSLSRPASSQPTSSAGRTVDQVDLGHRTKESAAAEASEPHVGATQAAAALAHHLGPLQVARLAHVPLRPEHAHQALPKWEGRGEYVF